MKKLFNVLFVAALFTFAACGNAEETKDADDGVEQSESTSTSTDQETSSDDATSTGTPDEANDEKQVEVNLDGENNEAEIKTDKVNIKVRTKEE